MRECQPAELLNQAAVLPTSLKVVSSLFSTSFIISLTKATFVNKRVNTRVLCSTCITYVACHTGPLSPFE